MAGDRGGNSRAESRKILILLGFVGIGARLLNYLGQHPLQSRSLQSHGRGFYRKCLRAKGFHFKTIAIKLFGDASEDHHLPGFEFHQQGH